MAKGSLTSFSCDLSVNGFQPTSLYGLGLDGEQVSEVDGAGNWRHTSVFADGKPLATYDAQGVHFPLTDWLGTKRVQANAAAQLDETCSSLPYGDLLTCQQLNGTDATEHHFTGKERDTETGLDYFGARYFSAGMGRFLSADWSEKPEAVPYASLAKPQSLNLYSYVGNNPVEPGRKLMGRR